VPRDEKPAAVILGAGSYRTVFILGAGATRGAVKHVLVNKKRLRAPLNSDFFRVAGTYARAEGPKSATAKRLKRIERAFEDEIPFHRVPTMEEAFSLLYTAKDLPEIYKTGRGRRPVAGFRQEIKDFLRLTTSILTTLDRRAPCPTGYDRLAEKLGGDDVIITLNYDTMFDSALVRRGWDPRKGYRLTGGSAKIKWLPKPVQEAAKVANVSLLKLHGSENWFVRGSYSDLGRVFDSKPVRVTHPRGSDIAGHIRQIVPPLYGKLFRHAHWRKLWSEAFEALCNAEVLVIIGCSLIDTDFHLRALIGRVARSRKKADRRIKRLILVGEVTARRKWARALRARFISKSDHKTLEHFLNKELGV
jgi:hypothetical protein